MKKWTILTAVSLLAGIASAQDVVQQPRINRLTFAVQPLPIFLWGVRTDMEVRIGNTRSWLQMGATIYPFTYREEAERDVWEYGIVSGDEYHSMWGGGLNINYKYFIHRLLYVAGGPSYQYSNVKYWGNYWTDFTEDGLTYHERKYDLARQQIHRLGAGVYFGHQRITRHSFLFDVYVGLGYHYGIPRYKDMRAFDSTQFSFGYRGVVFLAGIRLGGGIAY
ncbi:MAG: hypothetical protein LBF89_09565 [Bacteroidales bacterium]|nr:hypothetical protein [Bacteroidales bacterium]